MRTEMELTMLKIGRITHQENTSMDFMDPFFFSHITRAWNWFSLGSTFLACDEWPDYL